MNREQQTCRQCGHSSGAQATVAGKERCANGCECSGFMLGDSTPPATPVESPDENWFQRQARLAARDVQLLPPWLRSHPPAVLGEGERLMEQAAAYRAIALDALACWQGEDEHSDDNQKRNRSARSRATLRHRICAVDDTLRASTPTPGAPR